ncbi:MAG TPA: dolichyl-phosphate beta-glucosyltransferase, partial [Chthoniobacterales bacterium]|nr:dolichyl-phosphate beta-glucosyltransferase [Chthoniobacterales bacterium]
MESPQLAVIVPAYNEAARLAETLPKMISYLEATRPSSELIVVDDGSTDGTAEVAEAIVRQQTSLPSRVLRSAQNQGKGHAVRTGLLASSAPVALFSDADLSTPISELPKIVGPIETGDYDLVFGSRALDRKLIGHRQPWRREQGGRLFNGVVRLTTGLPFADTQCGFKAFRMSALRPIIEHATVNGFGFDVELLFLAQKAGLRLLEQPVRWDHSEGSKLHIVRDSLRMLGEVLAL